jgi:hypothetical protein
MKRMLIASALSIVTFTAAHAAPKVWQGDLFVTGNSGAACNGQMGASPGDFFRSVFRKGGLPGNGGNDMISLIGKIAAIHILPTAPSVGVLDAATAGDHKYIFGSAAFKNFRSRALSGVSVSPNNPTAATNVVVINITITRMFNKPGCDVTLFGRLSRRP